MKTAKEWGLTPAGWRKQSLDDRAMMVAFELFCNTREAYRHEWKENRDKQKEKGPNPYKAMKASMGLE